MFLRSILFERYKVYIAQTGLSAIEIASDKQPDLILLDLSLSDISGIGLLIMLKEKIKTKRIPVLVFVDAREDETKQKAVRFGASGVLKKPFDEREIREYISAHLEEAA
jgi:putative two-component system response regulator